MHSQSGLLAACRELSLPAVGKVAYWLPVGYPLCKLNADKTQLIWLGTRQQLTKLTVTQLCLTSSVVEFDSTITDLSVVHTENIIIAILRDALND